MHACLDHAYVLVESDAQIYLFSPQPARQWETHRRLAEERSGRRTTRSQSDLTPASGDEIDEMQERERQGKHGGFQPSEELLVREQRLEETE